MKKILIAISLLVGFAACEHQSQLDPQPTTIPEQATIATDVATGEIITTTAQRDFPTRGITADASGPAHLPEGTERSSANANATSSIGFEPNAGAIWKDPATGLTHLLALQLPGGGSSQIKWASLGSGWQGSTAIAMDRKNFYVVWNHKVYKNPKGMPGVWSLIVPSNGTNIHTITGYSNLTNNVTGGYIIRGGKLYSFSESGAIWLEPAQSDETSVTFWMAGLKHPDGSNSLYFRPSGGISGGAIVRYNQLLGWTNLSGYGYGAGVLPFSLIGNNMTNKLYESRIHNGYVEIVAINPYTGATGLFSSLQFTPANARLIVNAGYVWIIGDVLQRVMTLGSAVGQSNYNEYGWSGVQVACADQTLVF